MTLVAAGVFALLACTAAAAERPEWLQPQASHDRQRSGPELYATACENCHGPDGAGVSAAVVAFAEPLPDFRDCQFGTREPDADWLAVVHDGGPARAFKRMMPAYGEALTLEELERIVAYVRTFCDDPSWPRGELNLPRPLVTEKAFPEDEVVISTTIATEGPAQISNKLVYEQRIGARNQIEVIVPFTFGDGLGAATPGEGWRGGVGDLAVGMKRALFHSLPRGTIFSAAGEIVLPIGDESLGLSKGTALFEPFVSFGQLLPADAFVHAQTGVELPFDRDVATPEAFWRIAAGRSFSQQRWGRTWSPMVELLAARELESGGQTQWDIAPQMQVTLSTRQHIMAAGGVRFPINERQDRHPQVIVYLLWDWFDGPLFGGW